MTSILAVAVLGSWSYAGFLDEPGAGPPPAPPIPAPAPESPEKPRPPAPAPPAPDLPEPPANDRPAVPEVPKPPAARVQTAAVATPPARYRLADASGQVWEHPDPAHLRSFVEARNRSFFTVPAYYPAATPRYSSCSNGSCR